MPCQPTDRPVDRCTTRFSSFLFICFALLFVFFFEMAKRDGERAHIPITEKKASSISISVTRIHSLCFTHSVSRWQRTLSLSLSLSLLRPALLVVCVCVSCHYTHPLPPLFSPIFLLLFSLQQPSGGEKLFRKGKNKKKSLFFFLPSAIPPLPPRFFPSLF